jgi:2,4-dienoyl-CoA reductase-like NADH-dependent reductase (Old Yellow Enzyme family)
MQAKTLSTPIPIGKKTAPNRFVNHPMECNDADTSGNPTDLTLKRYRLLAEGGAGMIMAESMTISPESRSRKNQLQITERNRNGLAGLVKEMKTVNDRSLIIFQINHSGNVSNGSFSKVVSYYPTDDPAVTLLSDDDMEKIQQRFVEAAVIAHEAGADGIDFKQCHGYLCGQLLRPANTKPGRYGGSFENRTRFFRETAEKIKHAVNDDTFILGARFSFYEGLRGGFGTAGLNAVAEDPAEPTAFVRMMEAAGCHFISVSGGIPVFTAEITRPSKNYPLGVYRHFSWTETVRRAVNLPIIGSGYSYLRNGKNRLPEHEPEKKSLLYWAEKNVQNGHADLVGIGRQSLADPLFAKKVFSGDTDGIDYCTACGNCSLLLKSQARVGCTVFDPFYRDELRILKRANKQ